MNRLVLWILFSFFLLLFPVDIQANNNEQQKEHQYLLAMDALDSRYHRSRVRALRMLQDLIPTHRDRLLEDMRTHDSERVRFALAKMFASSGETEAVGPIVYNTIKANPATRIQWVDLLKGYRFFAYWYVDTLQQIQRPELREEDYSLDLAVLRNELLDAAVLRFYNTHPKKLFPSSVSNLWRYGEREVIERLKLILTDDNYPLLSALAENNRSRNTEVRARAIFLLGRSHRSQLVKNFLLGIYNEEVFAKDIYEEVPIGPWGATPVNRSPIWNLDDEAAIALWRSSNIKDFAQELINKSLSRAGSYKARNLDP